MMNNKKTTAMGIITLVGAIITVALAFMTGGDVGTAVNTALLPALSGLGLLMAGDGGL